MNKIIKSLIGFLCVVVFLITSQTIVFAGEINSAEQQVIDAASGTFEYNGSTYKAYPEYLSQLKSYFAQDDVDLLQSDVSSMISNMNSSIRDGIVGGYLYLVSGDGKLDPDDKATDAKDKKDSTSSADAFIKQFEKKTNQKFDKTTIKKSIEENKIFYHIAGDDSSSTNVSVDMVIKNTGYNVSRMIYAGCFLLGLMIVGFAAAFHFRLFAPEDES